MSILEQGVYVTINLTIKMAKLVFSVIVVMYRLCAK